MTTKKKSFNFEQSIQELESLVSNLEDGELSLENSLKTFEQGIKLTRECQQHLSAAEQKVALLIGDTDTPTLADFDNPQDS